MFRPGGRQNGVRRWGHLRPAAEGHLPNSVGWVRVMSVPEMLSVVFIVLTAIGSATDLSSSSSLDTDPVSAPRCVNGSVPNVYGPLYPFGGVHLCGRRAPLHVRCPYGQCCSSTGYCGPDVVPELRKRFGQLLHRTIEPATADLWSYKLFCDNAYADYRLIDCAHPDAVAVPDDDTH
ncbi:Uncharacterized protein PBTT_06566 [Plasmodiophora brassicae]|uniref:Uncharacterized protein n=1 Tax=Plasmodiophora brassicae TaxID=37360 RepID=A0A0G4IVJ0_PLABS|nr:hypothetical protein PBRA_001158 [Plasmodiophora brassicae]SPQ97262.1 unnamed protein product [Plasmodiophora brassicae]